VGFLRDRSLWAWGSPAELFRQGVPEGVEVPVGLWLETRLREQGWALGGGQLTPEGVAERVAAEIRS
jgi:hypothetical protein